MVRKKEWKTVVSGVETYWFIIDESLMNQISLHMEVKLC